MARQGRFKTMESATKGVSSVNMAENLEIDPVERALENWASWMSQPESLAFGYPAKAAGMVLPSWIKDSEEMYDELENVEAEAVDAAVDSLPRLERLAVYVHFGLGADVWTFHKESDLYAKAKITLLPLLRRRGAI